MRKIKKIIVHCADTPPSMDIGVEEIRKWHKDQGWKDVGYHYVIRRDGTVETGRDLTEVGAHVANHNADSIGICVVGGKGGFNFTWSQLQALKAIVDYLRKMFPEAELGGHCDYDSRKTCPNFDVKQLFEVE